MKKHKNQMYIIKMFIATAIVIGIVCIYLFYSSLNSSQLYISTKISNINNSQSLNFTLTDQKGKNFNSSYLKGHLSLIYFGVTYSIDDYNALKKIKEIVKILKKENIVIQIVFITLDPTHDTSVVLKDYLEKIDNNFIGLTGATEDIIQIAYNFKVFYEPKKLNLESGKYELNHSNFVYLINSEGKFLRHYCLGLPKNTN